MRVNCAAHSLTCATEPGAEVSSSEYTVWMESITTASGFSFAIAACIFSSCISANRCIAFASTVNRLARSAICWADSSPLTYRTFLWVDRCASACSSSVDLPIPGSPPINTTPPLTKPPPSTRSNSAMPVGVRGTSTASTSASVCTRLVVASALKRFFPLAISATLSTSVFQAEQCGHWPCHLGTCPPHSVQL